MEAKEMLNPKNLSLDHKISCKVLKWSWLVFYRLSRVHAHQLIHAYQFDDKIENQPARMNKTRTLHNPMIAYWLPINLNFIGKVKQYIKYINRSKT